jgi:histidine ammonia-lyase
MGLAAARKAARAVECLRSVVAIELLCAARGLEHRRPLRSGGGVEAAWTRIRDRVPSREGDRPLAGEIQDLIQLVEEGGLSFETLAAELEG